MSVQSADGAERQARDADGRQQIAFYQPGIGAVELPVLSATVLRLTEGATGLGIRAKVREAYCYLALNWTPGARVSIFGFSRGSYTARVIADLATNLGILRRSQLDNFEEIFSACVATADPHS